MDTLFAAPGNRRDRARFDALSPWDQDVARGVVARMYDGTRTVARCWTLALDATEDTPHPPAAPLLDADPPKDTP